MTGRVNHEPTMEVDEAQKRADSLFTAERREDCLATLLVAVILFILIFFYAPLSSPSFFNH